jgi:NADH:ubiquinone oxidoreductase subunit 6 (subunit J)
MNKKALFVGTAVAAVLMVMLVAVVLSDDIAEIGEDGMSDIPYTPDGDTLIDGSLPDTLFEKYGPVLLVLAILMFGAIIGGAYIAKEDDEDDTD